MSEIARRLAELERLIALPEQVECERLLALAASGRLPAAELVHCSDRQLWWLAIGGCRPMPEGEQLEAALQQILIGA